MLVARRFIYLASVSVSLLSMAPTSYGADARIEFFEKKIRPLLVDNCYNCHSADTNSRGGLRVDDRNGLLAGGNKGPAVVPGKPDESLLLKAVSHADKNLQMPPKKQLAAEQIEDLKQWIAQGAAWPEVRVPRSVLSTTPDEEYETLKREHWAWQPVRQHPVPSVRQADWPRDDIDRFVLSKLESKGLAPVGDADRVSLIRRVTFDLTGLPPTPQEIDGFVADRSADAFAKVVDRLLSSPAFGERWGRHWLDVARYAESTGPSRNIPFPHAWRYRDYVIDSVNRDKPYDQFIREQIAGDLLPYSSQAQRDEQLIATGFLAVGIKDVNQRFKVRFVMDNIDEQIDTVSQAFLGLTASCARCHDHKFDPITTREYHALAGIFHSTDLLAGVRNKMGGGGLDYYDSSMLVILGDRSNVTAPPERIAELEAELKKHKAAWDKIRGTPEGTARGPDGLPVQRAYRLRFEKAQADLAAVNDPAALGPVALGARDAQKVGDTEIRIRGEAEKLGPVAPRGFLDVARYDGQPSINPKQSGRLELAEWLSSPKNPLTAKVMANRVWQHLFGRGIVSSVDNFGVNGDRPTHPELLDHLAVRFVGGGWSVKSLVREIVLTRTYQLASEATEAHTAIDPAGTLLWRHNPRRLAAEEIRDATLAASGRLDRNRPIGSPASKLPFIEQRDNGAEAARFAVLARESVHRSVYLPLLRGWVPTSLQVFDFAEQGMVTGRRDVTTVAPQALYMLNDPFVRKQSLALARRVLADQDLGDAGRLSLAYRLTLGREPTIKEIDRAQKFLAELEPLTDGLLAAGKDAAVAASAPEAAVPSAPAGPATQPVAAATGNGRRRPRPSADATADAAGNTGQTATPAPLPVIDPDQVVTAGEDVPVEAIDYPDAKTAAWATLCQTLLGSAEFRYLR